MPQVECIAYAFQSIQIEQEKFVLSFKHYVSTNSLPQLSIELILML